MIESPNTNELQGQYELDDLLPKDEGTGNRDIERPEICPVDRFQRDGAGRPKGTGIAEGYDAEGHLLNVDYPPLQKPSPVGEGGTAQAVTEEVSDTPTTAYTPTAPTDIPPQTSADAARLTALATEIKVITEQTRATVISAALAVGKRLIEAKSICPAGRWLEWLETAVAYSERKAQDMMRLYLEYGRDGSIPDSIAALDYSKAVALLSAPADQREALAEQAQAEDLSVRELQQEIRRLNAEKLKDQMKIEGLEQQIDTAQGHIEQLTDEGNRQDAAIIDRDRQLEAKDDELKAAKRVIADAAEKVSLAQAKAAAAEASANELRRLHSDAEDRAAKSAQRASDAVNRANQTAKDLAEARAKIQALSEAAAAAVPEPERVEVEVVPEEVQRELEQLKRDLAEARANAMQGTGNREQGTGMAGEATAAEKFKWFYQNQMQPAFKTALTLLKEVAQEDGHAADAFATALTNACKVLMNQLGS